MQLVLFFIYHNDARSNKHQILNTVVVTPFQHKCLHFSFHVFFFPRRNSPSRFQVASLLRSPNHIQLDTHSLQDSYERVISSSQNTQQIQDEQPCPQPDSNPQSPQSNSCKPTPQTTWTPAPALCISPIESTTSFFPGIYVTFPSPSDHSYVILCCLLQLRNQ